MGSRTIAVLVLLLAGLALASVGVLTFQDVLHPVAPPPLDFEAPALDSPEFARAAESVPLRAAGVQVLLPKGTRIHPNTLIRSSEFASVQARTATMVFQISFYGADGGILGNGYLQAIQGPVEASLAAVLFGNAEPLMSQRKALLGGQLLRFDLSHEQTGRRRSLLVAIPEQGSGLATVTVDYAFDPAAALAINALAQKVSFPASAPPEQP